MNKKVRLSLILFAMALLGNACSFQDELANAINERFPPVNYDDIRSESLASNTTVLKESDSIDARIWISEHLINKQLSNVQNLESLGIQKIGVTLENQIPALRVDFRKNFRLNSGLPITLEGYLEGDFGIGIVIEERGQRKEGVVTFRPYLRDFHIDNATVDGKYDLEPVVNKLASLLGDYKDNISGVLEGKIDAVRFPIILTKNFVPEKIIIADEMAVRLSGQPVNVNASWKAQHF